jgi:hypothetical protein
MFAKSIFTSKTAWINGLTLALTMGSVLPPNKYVLGGLALANLGLRIVTGQPVVFFPEKRP